MSASKLRVAHCVSTQRLHTRCLCNVAGAGLSLLVSLVVDFVELKKDSTPAKRVRSSPERARRAQSILWHDQLFFSHQTTDKFVLRTQHSQPARLDWSLTCPDKSH